MAYPEILGTCLEHVLIIDRHQLPNRHRMIRIKEMTLPEKRIKLKIAKIQMKEFVTSENYILFKAVDLMGH